MSPLHHGSSRVARVYPHLHGNHSNNSSKNDHLGSHLTTRILPHHGSSSNKSRNHLSGNHLTTKVLFLIPHGSNHSNSNKSHLHGNLLATKVLPNHGPHLQKGLMKVHKIVNLGRTQIKEPHLGNLEGNRTEIQNHGMRNVLHGNRARPRTSVHPHGLYPGIQNPIHISLIVLLHPIGGRDHIQEVVHRYEDHHPLVSPLP
jgi:hypothetical protein